MTLTLAKTSSKKNFPPCSSSLPGRPGGPVHARPSAQAEPAATALSFGGPGFEALCSLAAITFLSLLRNPVGLGRRQESAPWPEPPLTRSCGQHGWASLAAKSLSHFRPKPRHTAVCQGDAGTARGCEVLGQSLTAAPACPAWRAASGLGPRLEAGGQAGRGLPCGSEQDSGASTLSHGCPTGSHMCSERIFAKPETTVSLDVRTIFGDLRYVCQRTLKPPGTGRPGPRFRMCLPQAGRRPGRPPALTGCAAWGKALRSLALRPAFRAEPLRASGQGRRTEGRPVPATHSGAPSEEGRRSVLPASRRGFLASCPHPTCVWPGRRAPARQRRAGLRGLPWLAGHVCGGR